jgi:hypothetical protein
MMCVWSGQSWRLLQECTIREKLAVVCFLWVKAQLDKTIHKFVHLCMARIVCHLRLFITGLRNLHMVIQNWKTLTHSVVQWKSSDAAVNQLDAVTGANRWVSTGDIVGTVGCSHVLAYSKMHDWLHFWKFCAWWTPRELNLEHKMTSNGLL